ncbi:arsenate reductase [Algoriphagus hitonicola]|uniref:Arsenate reductase n=2 Tax=Algoriphagus hitonicola TaxID=435880 RepID=A0A1I2T0L1_9BACT|nr:protein-tyrosine-phosphatase [Algoriphagus hitonicola]SFG58554.1 arsenate reductase [Algoriphagus hitonicola]
MTLFSKLSDSVDKALELPISPERKELLGLLIDFIQEKINQGEMVNLNFICTHNSRRSQFSQIWAQTAADYYGIPANCYSGGVEVTAFNERAVDSIMRAGFDVIPTDTSDNPRYHILHSRGGRPILAFSKTYDDPANDAKNFAAVMTCDHADENCPFIPGTEQRIPLRYEDPKAFDGTGQEAEKYDERSLQIASELFYVFSKIQKK